MVNSTTFHLQHVEHSLIVEYSDRFSKGTINYLHIQIFKFLEHVNRIRLRQDSMLRFRGMQFHGWQILNYFRNWNLILFVKDDFSYKYFSVIEDPDAQPNWAEVRSYRYFHNYVKINLAYPVIRRIINQKSKLIPAIKSGIDNWAPYVDFSFQKILLYLNYIFFSLPFILSMKKRFYNFIFFNFFRNGFHENKKFQIIFIITTEDTPSAFIVSQFICRKLIERFPVSLILRKVLIYMDSYYSRDLLNGFRVFVKGRITRKERMTYKWNRRGKLSLNTKYAPVDFFHRTLFMRYGTCSVQIWIQR